MGKKKAKKAKKKAKKAKLKVKSKKAGAKVKKQAIKIKKAQSKAKAVAKQKSKKSKMDPAKAVDKIPEVKAITPKVVQKIARDAITHIVTKKPKRSEVQVLEGYWYCLLGGCSVWGMWGGARG